MFTSLKLGPQASQVVLALSLMGACTSCSWMSAGQVTPKPNVPTPQDGSGDAQRIYYKIDPLEQLRAEGGAIRQGLEEIPAFSEVVFMSEAPSNGLFLKVSVEQDSRASFVNLWLLVSAFTLGAVPFYETGHVSHVTFDVYENRELKRSFTYEVVHRGLYWLGTPLAKPFLPSDWSDSLTSPQVSQGAFRATAHQVWRDLRGEGLLH